MGGKLGTMSAQTYQRNTSSKIKKQFKQCLNFTTSRNPSQQLAQNSVKHANKTGAVSCSQVSQRDPSSFLLLSSVTE